MSERAKRPSVDERCFDLAETFLDDLRVTILRKPTEDEVWALAAELQQVCEDFLLDVESREPPRPSREKPHV